MELKNIFEMTKADRYTQDGRDQIAKLQETEDKVYKTGEISQKTGLQKQPDGSWAPPKKGARAGAGKQAAGSINRTPERIAKETAIMEALNLSTGEDNNLHKMSDETIERLYARTQEKPAAGKTTVRQGPNTKILDEPPGEHIQKNLDSYRGYKPGDMEGLVLGPSGYKRQTSARIPSGGQSITYTKEGEEDITLFFDKHGELENADVSAATKPDAKEQTKALMEKYKDLPGAQKKDALYASTFEGIPIGMTQESMESQGWDLISTGEDTGEDINVYGKPDGSKVTMKHDGKKITSVEYEAPGSKDAAPKIRELTGDCKIKIRPETQDKVYQIGEISQKTGLQKTANGWRPVKKNGAGKPKAAEGWSETKMASGKLYDLKSQGKRIIEQYDPETETKTFKLRDLNNSRAPDKEFKTLEEAKAAAETKKENPTRTFEFKAGPDGNPVAGSGKEVKTYKTKKEAQEALNKQNTAAGKSAAYQRGEQLAKPAEKRQAEGYGHYSSGVLMGYSNQGLLEARKKLQEQVDEFDETIKDLDRRDLGPAAYASAINARNFQIGALKAIDEKMEERGMDPVPRFSTPDSAPRVLTGDTRIRIKK